ncbi:YigZ family protein [bacterium]|nr:YigZ family protein [bacterium]
MLFPQRNAVTAPKRYTIPAETNRVGETIDRSRFVTTVGHAPSVDDARAFVANVSTEFTDATHNCWAFVAGPPGDSSRVGMSDDGEPHGTAGRPMLHVLLHSDIGDIVAVVTRYYGGVKLGKGGLVRAYSGGVKLALESLRTRELVATSEFELVLDYSFLEAVRRTFPEFEVTVPSEEFGERVVLRIVLPQEHAELFAQSTAGVTSGGAVLRKIPSEEEA